MSMSARELLGRERGRWCDAHSKADPKQCHDREADLTFLGVIDDGSVVLRGRPDRELSSVQLEGRNISLLFFLFTNLLNTAEKGAGVAVADE